MKPFTRSIIHLFDGKKRYLIPLYQRQYAWKVDPQLKLLWEDITRAAKRLEANRQIQAPHFMGAIVISKIDTFGAAVTAYEVIDGQQRLTTFQLLLAALRDVAAENSSPYEAEAQKYLLNDGIMENPEIERFMLWPSLTDRRAFIHIIDPNVDADKIVNIPKDGDGYVKRAVLAHEFFREEVRKHVTVDGEFSPLKLERLFEALKTGLAVVSIELEGGDDPQTIFETLNSRGVELTASDLMRNFIFQRAKGMGQEQGSLIIDELYTKYWLPLDAEFWRKTDTRGRLQKPRVDWMLADHLAMKRAEIVSVANLFETYRRWILNETPFLDVGEELKSITQSASIERRLFEQNQDDILGKFGKFAKAFDVSTAMPLVLYLATEADMGEDLHAALHMIESYILRRDICGLTNKGYNKHFIDIIEKLRASENPPLQELEFLLSNGDGETTLWPNDERWRIGWLERDQYKGARQPRLRHIFELIEAKMRSEYSEDIEIKTALTIEHIMPQKWQTHWPVPGFEEEEFGERLLQKMQTEEIRQSTVHKMGNLTLLTRPLNSKVKNGPFSERMPIIKSHTSLALNRDLNHYDSWSEDNIAIRGQQLFEIAKQLWQGPIDIPSPNFEDEAESSLT